MKKKTIKALKKLSKLSPAEKVAATVMGAVYVPVAVIGELSKNPRYQLKPKKRRRRKLF